LPGGGGLTAPHTRSNRPPLDSRLSSCFRCLGACALWLLVVFVLGLVALQWLRGFGKQKVEVRSV
jgi:hypothetical protein